MRAKDFIPAEKPRNFVAKNAKMGGAGQHKDKKKAEKQGNVKHKKDLATMEQGVAEGEADYGPDYQDKVKRLGQMAKQGERKTVWDPVKRVYKTVPVNSAPEKK
jgi:hypothetical protein